MTDWMKILTDLGDERRLVIQAGIVEGTAEVRVEDRDPDGARASYHVTHEAVERAAIDVMVFAIDECAAKLNAGVPQPPDAP